MAAVLTDVCVYPAGIRVAGAWYSFAQVLPPVASPAEGTLRAAMRASGMIRPVTTTDTLLEFAGQILTVSQAAPAGFVLAAGPAGLAVVAAPGT